MKKIFTAFFVVLFISTPIARAAECLGTDPLPICVGEAHDSVVGKLGSASITGESIKSGKLGQVVERSYSLQGRGFSLRFERTFQGGPYRLTSISEATETPIDDRFVVLGPFLANLADPAGKRYIKAIFSVETSSQNDVDAVYAKSRQVRDSIITLLLSKSYADVSSIQAKFALKDEVKNAVNTVFKKKIVQHVFIVDLVIQ